MVEQRHAGQAPAPALIVCPPTLVGHWQHEIGKFVAPDVLRPLAVQGPPQVPTTFVRFNRRHMPQASRVLHARVRDR